MFIACFDAKNPKTATVAGFETIEEAYADLKSRGGKACPPFDDIIVGKDLSIDGLLYCLFEDEFLAQTWITDHKYARNSK